VARISSEIDLRIPPDFNPRVLLMALERARLAARPPIECIKRFRSRSCASDM